MIAQGQMGMQRLFQATSKWTRATKFTVKERQDNLTCCKRQEG